MVLPSTSIKVWPAPLTMISAMSSRASKRLQRAIAKNIVADVLEQLFLLGDRHREILDRDDIVDDIADFLARAFAVKLGQLRQIDGIDQRREDLCSWCRNIPMCAPCASWRRRCTVCGRGARGQVAGAGSGACHSGAGIRLAKGGQRLSPGQTREAPEQQPAAVPAADAAPAPPLPKPSFPRLPNIGRSSLSALAFMRFRRESILATLPPLAS